MSSCSKRPFGHKVLIVCVVLYTLYSIKVDIGNYSGKIEIQLQPDNFKFEHSICNPRVIKAFLLKVKSRKTYFSGRKNETAENDVKLPYSDQHVLTTPNVETVTWLSTSSKVEPITKITPQKNDTSLNKGETTHSQTKFIPVSTITSHMEQRNIPVTDLSLPDIESSKNTTISLHPGKQNVPQTKNNIHDNLREQVLQREKAKDIVMSANRPDDVKDVQSVVDHVISNTDTTAAPPTVAPVVTTKAIGRPPAKLAKTRVINALPRPDFMNSPYYMGSIHPLHIDLAKYVHDYLERGVAIPVDPINPTPTGYIHTPQECEFESSKDNFNLLVIVRSDVRHLDMRNIIRETWGSVSLYPNVKLVFLVGIAHNTRADVDEEAKIYGDLLQGNFQDHWINSTYKTVMAFKWQTTNCPRSDVILIAEDSHIVQISYILKYIRTFAKSDLKKLLAGFVINYAEVERKRNSRWAVRWQDYPHKFWPPYLREGAFLVSKEIVRQLVVAIPYVKYLHIHDAYLGIVAKKLSLDLTNDVRFYQTKNNLLHTRQYFAYEGFKTPKVLNDAWYDFTKTQK